MREGEEMITAEKVIEDPTEIDAEVLFDVLHKPMEALQALLMAEIARIEKDGVTVVEPSVNLTIRPTMLTVKIGDYCVFHEVNHYVSKLG